MTTDKDTVKPGKEKFDAPTPKPAIASDGAPVIEPAVEVHPGQVMRIQPLPPPDRMAETEPASSGRTNDEAFRG